MGATTTHRPKGEPSSCSPQATSPNAITKETEATARIVTEYPEAAIATLGDNAYPDGASEDFQECYDPTWGQFKLTARRGGQP